MTVFEGTPSDDAPDVLATGGGDVTTVFVSLSARHPEGRDAEYLEWHTLDHRPEQHRLAGLRGSLRFVSTPACRAVRAASDARFDATDHVVAYLFSSADLDPFFKLGAALGRAGRMPIRLPSVHLGTYAVAGRVAAARVLAGADVVPWRPATGVYLLLEAGGVAPAGFVDVDGVAGVWWAADAETQLTMCFLDDDPVAVADRLRPVLDSRWAARDAVPLLAAPFLTLVPFEWDRHLPREA